MGQLMFKKMAQHAKLTNRMAARAGYDIPEALAQGTLRDEQMQSMVRRCLSCDHPESCADLPTEGAEVPEFCKNRWFFTPSS